MSTCCSHKHSDHLSALRHILWKPQILTSSFSVLKWELYEISVTQVLTEAGLFPQQIQQKAEPFTWGYGGPVYLKHKKKSQKISVWYRVLALLVFTVSHMIPWIPSGLIPEHRPRILLPDVLLPPLHTHCSYSLKREQRSIHAALGGRQAIGGQMLEMKCHGFPEKHLKTHSAPFSVSIAAVKIKQACHEPVLGEGYE